MSTYSEEYKLFLKKQKQHRWFVRFFQIFILIFFLGLWQIASSLGWINTFLSSSPWEVVQTTINLATTNELFHHIWITVYETIISFSIAAIFGFLVAALLWWIPTLAKIMDPYLTVFNSLPKVALGPLIIIWVGASINSIIFMALMISFIITIINIYNGFQAINPEYITLMQSFHASKWQIFWKLIFPGNMQTLINSLKINISMSLIGVIMGELLVSKQGLGYLIMYGSQVFHIDLVITSVVILGVVSYFMYYLVSLLEKKLNL